MRVIYIFLLLNSTILTAQVLDNFSDADIILNPIWSGDTAEFTVVNGQLRSNSNTTSHAFYLSTSSTVASDAQWEFYVNLKLQTSSANYTDIFLISDQSNLKSLNNSGYFVRIGNTSDEISLYKRLSGINTEIIDGLDLETNSSNNTIRVKVTRDTANVWTLQSNTIGTGFSYTMQGNVTDNSILTSAYFGVLVQQSTINFHYKHFFDDFYIGPIVVDNTSPSILSSKVISNTQIDILFDEWIELSSAQTSTNYNATNGLGNPVTATRDANNFSLVHLTFSNTFGNGIINALSVANVLDLNGNSCSTSTLQFSYVAPIAAMFKDIVINEIFADPTPPIGLPSSEFIELYNRTELPINLNGWKFTDGSTTATLSNYTLLPGEYLILCSKTDTAAYSLFGNFMGVSSFPSLNNAGDHIYLKDNQLNVIDSVNYSDDWYNDVTKKTGGYTLELINPHSNPNCPLSNYWMASNNTLGGTPGKINSNTNFTDNETPRLLDVIAISNDTVQVHFNKAMDIATLLSTDNYNINNGILEPLQVQVDPDFKSVKLKLGIVLQEGIMYTLIINNIKDCAGNVMSSNTATFVIPASAIPNDVVINEILFDPKIDGVDFVEIYNRSNKIIDLKTLTLSQYDTIHNTLVNIKNITTESYLIHPGDYLVLSENDTIIKSHYQTTHPNGFLNMKDLPTMNIASGTVCLASSSVILDILKYNVNMQFPLLNFTKGVSLERIDFNRPTSDKTNWHSAAESVGLATPAYQNSQYKTTIETATEIEIAPAIFSPDEDGINDVVNINYHFDTPGLIANITIYDAKGQAIKQLVRNELLGISGVISWDGINENREKAKIGMYIFYMEVFDLTGKVKHYKNPCVLAGKLD